MLHTHRAIRDLLRHETKNPIPVNAMALVRSQLESLYATCLIVEQPAWLEVYLKDGWKTLYIRYLLMREQSAALRSVMEQLAEQAEWMEGFRKHSGVTEEEKLTIEADELGKPLPKGMPRRPIPQFPTPGKLIELINDHDRIKVLQRLYPEYRYLCSFVHSPNARVLTAFFDDRELYARLLRQDQIELVFQKEIASPGLWLDVLCIVQSCSEFIELYPADVELSRVLTEAWNSLIEKTYIGRIIWELRSQRLLGAIR
jgi:hypothetical protein